MTGLKKFLTSFPSWTFTIVWIVVMMWLFLTPQPLVDSDVTVGHPTDKIGHFLCVGFLAVAIMLDYQRKHQWHALSVANFLASAGVAIIVGGAMEIAQISCFFARKFDAQDLVAQVVGVIVWSLSYFLCQRFWVRPRS